MRVAVIMYPPSEIMAHSRDKISALRTTQNMVVGWGEFMQLCQGIESFLGVCGDRIHHIGLDSLG